MLKLELCISKVGRGRMRERREGERKRHRMHSIAQTNINAVSYPRISIYTSIYPSSSLYSALSFVIDD
jgi:hypothetical protein